MTANRLRDGAVVFLDRSGSWTETIDEAALAAEPRAAAEFEQQASAAVEATEITGPYLFDAERIDGRLRPLHIRERIRTLGPTVRADLGKQADGTGGAFPAEGA
jgi:hypothetical protein